MTVRHSHRDLRAQLHLCCDYRIGDLGDFVGVGGPRVGPAPIETLERRRHAVEIGGQRAVGEGRIHECSLCRSACSRYGGIGTQAPHLCCGTQIPARKRNPLMPFLFSGMPRPLMGFIGWWGATFFLAGHTDSRRVAARAITPPRRHVGRFVDHLRHGNTRVYPRLRTVLPIPRQNVDGDVIRRIEWLGIAVKYVCCCLCDCTPW